MHYFKRIPFISLFDNHMNDCIYERNPGPLRPREKVRQTGIHGLSDMELLQLILGSGSRDHRLEALSRSCLDILDIHGGDCRIQDLEKIPGVGPAKAAQLLGSLEFCRRLYQPRRQRIRKPQDLHPHLAHFSDRPQEVFLAATLNGAHELLQLHTVTVGIANRTLIHPREVFAPALADRACSIILAHNHPSGHLEPSREDREVTERMCSCGRLLGIEVLDHLIFSFQGYYSFRQENDLF